MFNFQNTGSSMLDSIEKIHQTVAGSELKEDILSACKEAAEHLALDFSCSTQEAILLAILLRQHYQNNEPSISSLIEHCGLKRSHAVEINKILASLVEKGWIRPKQDIRYFPFTNYKIDRQFIRCITTSDWSHLQGKPVQNSYELLERFGKYLENRKTGDISYAKLVENTLELLKSNQQLPLPVFIREKQLNTIDTILFLAICYRHYTGADSFDFESLLGEIRPPLRERFDLREQIKARQNAFFEAELIERSQGDSIFSSEEQYCLSMAGIRSFHPDPLVTHKKIKSPFWEILEPGNIPCKQLFYPDSENAQIQRLFELMKPDNFKAFSNRMLEKGSRPGLTVLLYGTPGTGKTESVLQLARQNDRTLLVVDASSIRSKWVGETEKNIKRLFQDYKKTVEQTNITPILLFNEADAILGKRRAVTDRVEQMENTLQNILLQELENFEGIFIATTNMEENLDPAFDRRILYKVRFSAPGNDLRMAIWKEKLPNLPEDLLKSVNQQYSLTGGQIDNIAKKIEVGHLLYPEIAVDINYLSALAVEELSLRSRLSRTAIGFTRTADLIK